MKEWFKSIENFKEYLRKNKKLLSNKKFLEFQCNKNCPYQKATHFMGCIECCPIEKVLKDFI